MYKKFLAGIASITICFLLIGCNKTPDTSDSNETSQTASVTQPTLEKYQQYATMSAEEITACLTLEEKAAQMMQPAGYMVDRKTMKENGYGSALAISDLSENQWQMFISDLQKGALESSGGVPLIYGNDAVHGVNSCKGAVIFPHNIAIGAANDSELTYKMGLAVADEAKITGMLWTFSPCVAVAQDPRWGRTYESYSSDIDLVSKLGTEFAKGLIDGGLLPCAKHYLGDGEVYYGTGEHSDGDGEYVERLIDRGDAIVDDARLNELISVYKSLIDNGVKTVMISHNSVNGEKMHSNKELITDVLKGELGFDGLVVSDWESIYNIPGDSLKEQIITSVNAGIDMFMQPHDYEDCMKYIVEAVNEGLIKEERINDAVTRIISVKKQMGLFDDPLMKNLQTKQSHVGSDEYRNLAKQLVEKSLVLLKNENEILPLKNGTKLYITGPAADDTRALCGGWTLDPEGGKDSDNTRWVQEGKTILDGFKALADQYEFTIITDPAEAINADITILCLGEKPYHEWHGDTEDLSITGEIALDGNKEAISEAKELGKPIVTLITVGRNVIIDEYENDWDAIVMCWLPGSEGDGVANVIAGKVPFTGKLPMPYYSSVDDIRTNKVKFEIGYGLSTG